jgi:type II secretory pathway pseudopilin PulG
MLSVVGDWSLLAGVLLLAFVCALSVLAIALCGDKQPASQSQPNAQAQQQQQQQLQQQQQQQQYLQQQQFQQQQRQQQQLVQTGNGGAGAGGGGGGGGGANNSFGVPSNYQQPQQQQQQQSLRVDVAKARPLPQVAPHEEVLFIEDNALPGEQCRGPISIEISLTFVCFVLFAAGGYQTVVDTTAATRTDGRQYGSVPKPEDAGNGKALF